MSWAERLDQLELLDGDDIPQADLERNLVELDIINRRLGGHRITLAGMERLIWTPRVRIILQQRPLRICEIGCGGGDNLWVIDRWARRRNIRLDIVGVDLKETCTAYAERKRWHNPTFWMTRDYREFDLDVDIIFSSLFCHHFPDEELPPMLRWMNEHASAGFFINDLHRHPLAYHSIKWLTRAFSRSYLVKNDAPLSVRRAFVHRDWDRYLTEAGLSHASVYWKWAFRWLVVAPKPVHVP
ncbi:MAG TPA: methyltransferase domain-containing protein [Dinghuibacter sp.]|uniref:methyltransferase domain-containing protein n=1 Tax=Dinghuibacter sp. TaxID=2024697 RepID=UPI002B5D6B8A|nr:methyltransferase domain-containing protein [Dinghuibacter sp.]HTJ12168.1 methyltransferase domain-containing protein [Dinghuibacter sp.]